MTKLNLQKSANGAVLLALVLILCYILKPVIAPLVLAIILAIVLLPICTWLENKGFNRLFSSLTTVVCIVVSFLGIATIGFFQLRQLANQYGDLELKFFSKLNDLSQLLPVSIQPPTMRDVEDVEKILPEDLTTLEPLLSGFLLVSGELFTTLTIVPIFMFFILFYRNKIVKFSSEIQPKNTQNKNEVLEESKSVIQKYLSGLGLVVLIIAALATIGLWVIGIKYALLLGVLSAVLTVIPYIGTFAGALIPVLIAFLTKDSAAYGFAVMVLYAVIQIAESNLITPLVLGNSVNVNPFVSILALLIMGQYWGIIGMIVAIPITAILIVVLNYSEKLSPLNILLKNEP